MFSKKLHAQRFLRFEEAGSGGGGGGGGGSAMDKDEVGTLYKSLKTSKQWLNFASCCC